MIDFIKCTKKYENTLAIDNLSISLHEKKIYCLLGRNGAGKTTFMNLLAGKIQATKGEVLVNGTKVTTLNMPDNVRYIQTATPQFNMRITELIDLAAGVDSCFNKEFAMRMINKFNLDKKKKYNALSFGMKTMVTTIVSLASNDDIILLDEPVLGFDAVMRNEFYSLLSESFTEHPRIIIISTHLIDEIAGISEEIIMIEKGKLVLNEDINTVIEKSYKVTGIDENVKLATKDLNVICTEKIGKFSIAYIYDHRIENNSNIEVSDLSVQELFIKMSEVNKNE